MDELDPGAKERVVVVVVVGAFSSGGNGDAGDGNGGTGVEKLRLEKGFAGIVVGLTAGGLMTRWNV